MGPGPTQPRQGPVDRQLPDDGRRSGLLGTEHRRCPRGEEQCHPLLGPAPAAALALAARHRRFRRKKHGRRFHRGLVVRPPGHRRPDPYRRMAGAARPLPERSFLAVGRQRSGARARLRRQAHGLVGAPQPDRHPDRPRVRGEPDALGHLLLQRVEPAGELVLAPRRHPEPVAELRRGPADRRRGTRSPGRGARRRRTHQPDPLRRV